MDNQVTLKVAKREVTGKTAARQLRRDGFVPANLYGRDDPCQNLKVGHRELEALVTRISVENTLVELEVEGAAPRTVLIREIQKHPWRQVILHVDFLHIKAGEKIKVAVPIHLVGAPEGVRNDGGILQQTRHELEVECLPKEIPESFEVDVTALEIGDSIHVADIDSSGVTILDDPVRTVCTVQPPLAEEVVEELEDDIELEDMEPEVITAREDGDEEAEEVADD